MIESWPLERLARALLRIVDMTTKPKPPWKRPNPKAKRGTTKLSPAAKSRAKARAKRAGRRYPNLVDNMREAASTTKNAKKKRASS